MGRPPFRGRAGRFPGTPGAGWALRNNSGGVGGVARVANPVKQGKQVCRPREPRKWTSAVSPLGPDHLMRPPCACSVVSARGRLTWWLPARGAWSWWWGGGKVANTIALNIRIHSLILVYFVCHLATPPAGHRLQRTTSCWRLRTPSSSHGAPAEGGPAPGGSPRRSACVALLGGKLGFQFLPGLPPLPPPPPNFSKCQHAIGEGRLHKCAYPEG